MRNEIRHVASRDEYRESRGGGNSPRVAAPFVRKRESSCVINDSAASLQSKKNQFDEFEIEFRE